MVIGTCFLLFKTLLSPLFYLVKLVEKYPYRKNRFHSPIFCVDMMYDSMVMYYALNSMISQDHTALCETSNC